MVERESVAVALVFLVDWNLRPLELGSRGRSVDDGLSRSYGNYNACSMTRNGKEALCKQRNDKKHRGSLPCLSGARQNGLIHLVFSITIESDTEINEYQIRSRAAGRHVGDCSYVSRVD